MPFGADAPRLPSVAVRASSSGSTGGGDGLPLSLPAGGQGKISPEAIERGVYVACGAVTVGGSALAVGDLALLRDRAPVDLLAGDAAELLVLGGNPLDAPIRRYGPFVMDTDAELADAARDYQAGRFGRIRS